MTRASQIEARYMSWNPTMVAVVLACLAVGACATDSGVVDASPTTAGDAMSEAATEEAGIRQVRRELDHLAASDERIQALGNTADAVSVELRPDAEPLAARLDDKYGDAVELLLGGVPYPPSKIPDDFDGCPSPPVEPWPRGVTTSLELDDERVPQGGSSTRGVVTVRNMSDKPFVLDVEDPVWGWVYDVDQVSPPLGHPGVVYTALASGGSEPSGPRRDLAPGESTSISVPVGTASCSPERGYALATGVYDVRVQFGVRDDTAHVSQPARLRVTHR